MKKTRNFNWRYIRNSIFVVGILVWVYMFLFPGNVRKISNDKAVYRNETCVIVGTNEDAQSFTNDKFHKPMIVKVWLIRRISDTTQFAELTNNVQNSGCNTFYITNKLWYEKGIGDTLYFNYILKNRFFIIDKTVRTTLIINELRNINNKRNKIIKKYLVDSINFSTFVP